MDGVSFVVGFGVGAVAVVVVSAVGVPLAWAAASWLLRKASSESSRAQAADERAVHWLGRAVAAESQMGPPMKDDDDGFDG